VGEWVGGWDGCKRDAETRNKKNFIKLLRANSGRPPTQRVSIYGKLSHLNLPLVCESYLCSVVVVVVWWRRKRTYAEAPTAKQERERERERERCEEEEDECVAFVISNKKHPKNKRRKKGKKISRPSTAIDPSFFTHKRMSCRSSQLRVICSSDSHQQHCS
jgi:hypothetical protein